MKKILEWAKNHVLIFCISCGIILLGLVCFVCAIFGAFRKDTHANPFRPPGEIDDEKKSIIEKTAEKIEELKNRKEELLEANPFRKR